MKLKKILEELHTDQKLIDGNPTNTPEKDKSGIRDVIKNIEEYNSYGNELKRSVSLPEIAKKIKNAVDGASKIALEEISDDDWFDRKTLERNLNETKKYLAEFEKISNEVHAKERQLEALYDDIGFRLSRYYNIK